jgi:hypothetical protein
MFFSKNYNKVGINSTLLELSCSLTMEADRASKSPLEWDIKLQLLILKHLASVSFVFLDQILLIISAGATF